jgi:hypothetical protein
MTTQSEESEDLPTANYYAGLATERAALNQLLWQAPMVSLTAQAFLLRIAYDATANPVYQVAAGLVASVVGFASWQLFLRHSALEVRVSREMERVELKYRKRTFHHRPNDIPIGEEFYGLAACPSRPIWAHLLFWISFAGFVPIARCIIL